MAQLDLELTEIELRAEERRLDAIRDEERRVALLNNRRTIRRRLGTDQDVAQAKPNAPKTTTVAPPVAPLAPTGDRAALKDFEALRLRLALDAIRVDGQCVNIESLVRELLPKAFTVRRCVLVVISCMPWLSSKEVAAVIRLVRDVPDGSVGGELSAARRAELVVAKVDTTSRYANGVKKPLLHAATDLGAAEVGAVCPTWYRAARGEV